VTLVVNTGLDAVTNVDSKFGGSSLKLSIETGVLLEDVSEEVVVIGKIGEFIGQVLGRESGSLLGADVLFVSTTELNPLGESGNSLVETGRRVRSGDVINFR
jgi:hypothetical protein